MKALVKSYSVYSKSYKIKLTFYHNTLHKLLCKHKDSVAKGDKISIFYKLYCSKCQADYFGESKSSLKSRSNEHKRSAIIIRMALQNTLGKKITTLAGIRINILIGKQFNSKEDQRNYILWIILNTFFNILINYFVHAPWNMAT